MSPLSIFNFVLCAVVATHAYADEEKLGNLTLNQAVQIALQNHRSLQVSQANTDKAEEQYQQAMAAFRPQLNLAAGFQRADQNRTFTFEGAIQTPAMNVAPGFTLPSQTLPMNIEVNMFNRDVTKAELNFSYPLYTGGKEAAIKAMAQKGVAIAQEEQRKSELEVIRDVRKYYHGAQFAQHMAQLANDTLARFQALDDLTERLYQNASLKVKKTDYLRGKTTTAMVSAAVQEANYGSTLAKAALANAMGLSTNSQLTLAREDDVPVVTAELEHLIRDAMAFNPDKQRLELALAASEYKISEAKSGYLPMVGLEASAYQVWNGYKSGLFNDANRKGWTIGVGVKWNLFDGGMTRANIGVAQADKIKLEAQRVLLDNGLALQIKDSVMRIQRSRSQVQASVQAQSYAEENRKLNVRAYQEEMVETKDVIEAQLVESFASAGLYKAHHELQTALSDLDFLVGKAMQQARE